MTCAARSRGSGAQAQPRWTPGGVPAHPCAMGTSGGIGGPSGAATTAQVCARCGHAVSPATSYLTEVGLLCWPCFGNFQSQQQLAEVRDADLQRSQTRRARSLAGAHWVIWAGVLMVATSH